MILFKVFDDETIIGEDLKVVTLRNTPDFMKTE